MSGNGIEHDHEKIATVKEFLIPKSLKQLRICFGLAGYHRKYIEDVAANARPLYDLKKRDGEFV